MTTLLTEAEAAKRLSLSPRMLRNLRKEGKLHYVRFGKAVRYDPDDLADYIESARSCQSPPAPDHPSSGMISRSTVADFEAARKRRTNAKRG